MMTSFHCGRYRFSLASDDRPLVMGVLNVTPDSFSDGGRFAALESAISHAEQMIAEGVDIIDIGGESSRPGAPPLPLEEELRRVMPVLYALRDCGKPISIDTYKPAVMELAIQAGADMINDIRGFRTPGALTAVNGSEAALCIMHMQNDPQSMQQNPHYDDAVAEITQFLRERVQECESAGISRNRICVDPGFGFGKTLAHNLSLLRNLKAMQTALDVPLLAGLSRKSMLGAITGRGPDDRMAASVAAAVMAVMNGARIVRVHDVGPTVDALKVWHAVANGEQH